MFKVKRSNPGSGSTASSPNFNNQTTITIYYWNEWKKVLKEDSKFIMNQIIDWVACSRTVPKHDLTHDSVSNGCLAQVYAATRNVIIKHSPCSSSYQLLLKFDVFRGNNCCSSVSNKFQMYNPCCEINVLDVSFDLLLYISTRILVQGLLNTENS